MPTKIVLGVAIDDEKCKRRAMTVVAAAEGVESITLDMKERKITVIGEADPVCLTAKLRKIVFTELLSVGYEKTPEEKKKEAEEKKKKEEEEKKKKEAEEKKKKEEEEKKKKEAEEKKKKEEEEAMKKKLQQCICELHLCSCERYPCMYCC